MSTATNAHTHVTLECRLTVGEREALAEVVPVIEMMVDKEVISMKGVDRDAALSGLKKLTERILTAGDW